MSKVDTVVYFVSFVGGSFISSSLLSYVSLQMLPATNAFLSLIVGIVVAQIIHYLLRITRDSFK